MSDFDDLVDEWLGDSDDVTDIQVVVRRLFFYDFDGYPVRLWQGKGKLTTSDGEEWLGTIDGNNTDHHEIPPIQDGRDGSSATYTFGLTIPELPGQDAGELYEAMKADQSLVAGRKLVVYLAAFKPDEGLRPTTPKTFFKELTMFSPKFTEGYEQSGHGIKRVYKVSVPAKDSNFGRSAVPNGTYSDTVQKRRAEEHGVANDRGCEYVALLANRTMQFP